MRRQRTEEQKKRAIERRQKLRAIARDISKMPESDRLALVHDWPTTIEGHKLSLHNACMVIVQSGGNGSTPTVLGGFQQWKKAGRVVKKGEHGYGIWIPLGLSKRTDDQEQGETIHEGSPLRFSVATVFDITQTEELTNQNKGPSLGDVLANQFAEAMS